MILVEKRAPDVGVQEAVGAVSEVVQVLMHAAFKRWPMREISERYFNAKGIPFDGDFVKRAKKALLIQDLSCGQVRWRV